MVRLNFSHGNHQEHIERAQTVRNRARAHGRQVGVLVELQGPKISIDRFKDGKVVLEDGARFVLDAKLASEEGTIERVGIAYKQLPEDIDNRGDTLLLDDGAIVLWVEDVNGPEIECRVVVGGALSNNKGINRQGGGLSAKARKIRTAPISKSPPGCAPTTSPFPFPRCADDINEARELLRAAGGHGGIVAKIERARGDRRSRRDHPASDVVMIARGDAGRGDR